MRTRRASSIREVIEAPDSDLHVPSLCDIEVCSALRRALLRNLLSAGRASQALTDYLDLPLIRHSHLPLLERILQLGENFTAYDATYVSLAEMLQAPLVTADDSLARTVKGLVPDTGPPPL